MRIAAARSGLTKFHYEFCDDRAQPLGTLTFPTGLVLAKGSAASGVPGALQDRVRFTLPDGTYELEFTGPPRDRHFTLVRGGTPVATAVASGRHRREVSHGARVFHLARRFSLLRVRFEVREAGQVIGSIFEPALFSLVRRHFALQLPLDVPDEARALLFFLVVNSVFR